MRCLLHHPYNKTKTEQDKSSDKVRTASIDPMWKKQTSNAQSFATTYATNIYIPNHVIHIKRSLTYNKLIIIIHQ